MNQETSLPHLPAGLLDAGQRRTSAAASPLLRFISSTRSNLRFLWLAVGGSILQFVIFKILYPFPDFIGDSASYIATNLYHMKVNLWPIGYSVFIGAIHAISHSDTFLVAIQYFMLQTALLYFFYTITALYNPSKSTTLILFLFLIFNPLSLYLGNSVISDALFISLSLVFLTQFLRMLQRPALSQVLVQGIIVGLAFTVRYTAAYYPLVSIVGLLLSKHRPVVKIAGPLFGIALIIPFVLYTQQKTKDITGTAEFSVFGGWQLANNALYMYEYIKVDSTKLPKETIALDRVSRQFFKYVEPSRRDYESFPGTFFIKIPFAILKPYMAAKYDADDPVSLFKAWGQVSPIYKKYGTYLITHYPIEFSEYYLWLNTKNYFLPHLEKFDEYNRGDNIVKPEVQDWFDYVTPEVHAVSINFQGKLFYLYPILFMTLNFYFAGSLLWLFFTGQFKRLNYFLRSTLIFTAAFTALNFCFSVFATPVVLRYEVIPMILLFTFSLLLMELPNNKKQLSKINPQ